jgi:predicted NACHT family NTPase
LHGQPSAPQGADTPAWLLHFLRAASKANHWNLDAELFRSLLQQGRCTVLLDGLDEAPDDGDAGARHAVDRKRDQDVSARAAGSSPRVPRRTPDPTSCPDFAHARIDPLSDEAVRTFLSHWCGKLYRG